MFGSKFYAIESFALTVWWWSTMRTAESRPAPKQPRRAPIRRTQVASCRDGSDSAAFSAAVFIIFISCKLGLINCCWICRGVGLSPCPDLLLCSCHSSSPFPRTLRSPSQPDVFSSAQFPSPIPTFYLTKTGIFLHELLYRFMVTALSESSGARQWENEGEQLMAKWLERSDLSLWKLHFHLFVCF